MFCGYAQDHDIDCYRMWDSATNRMHLTRDVIWLQRMYYEKKTNGIDIAMEPLELCDEEEPPSIKVGEGDRNNDRNEVVESDFDEEVEEVSEPTEDKDEDDDDEPEVEAVITRSGRTIKP